MLRWLAADLAGLTGRPFACDGGRVYLEVPREWEPELPRTRRLVWGGEKRSTRQE